MRILAAVLGTALLVHADVQERTPNIIFILLDNVGQEWFGCYGSEEGTTPQIDALARSGLRFEHCATPPVCGPSRVVLLTGRYPFRTGWTMHHDAALYSGGGLDPEREILFPRVLRSTGYVTGIAGKWQVNNLYDEPDALARHGFDEHLVWPGSIDWERIGAEGRRQFVEDVRARRHEELSRANTHIESRYWDPVLIRNGRRETHPGKFGPDLLQEFALDFLKRHRDRRFMLYYPMVLTHGQAFLEPAVSTPLNRGRSLTDVEKFADMLRYADRLVGDLVKALDELKLRENTILFVATDNGTEKRFSARRNGRRVQGALYQLTEAGSDVPLIANCPRLIPGGRTAALADFTDLYPTFCGLAGARLPEKVTLDGRSLEDVLRGRAASSGREWIFNQYHPRRVVRDARHKLYSTGEFYDLEADPDEKEPLAATQDSAVRDRLQRVLASLPSDTPLPFEHRSLSAFKIHAEKERK